jgi:hypothetical protein
LVQAKLTTHCHQPLYFCSVDLFSRQSSNVQTVSISMNTNKAIYWIALAAFALALHSEYQKGSFPAVHRVAGRAEFMLCRVAARADQTFALARLLATRPAFPPDGWVDTSTTKEIAENQVASLQDQARDKADLIRDQMRAQVEVIRAEARTQRAQIWQMRTRTQFKLDRATVRRLVVKDLDGCPKVRTAVDPVPDSAPESSDDE